MAKRIKIGDIVEVSTGKGLAYAQCTHKVPQWGHLLRVLPDFFDTRPEDITVLATHKSAFLAFFPLQAAVNRNIVTVIGNCAVPADAAEFPLFRASGWRDKSGNVLDWWLWDGSKSWQVGKLTPDQRALPIKEVINDTLLIERIEKGWRPETDRD